jgi:hypothetical protein
MSETIKTSSLLAQLGSETTEKDIENAYRTELERQFGVATGFEISSPHKSDGYMQVRKLRALLEFKLNFDLVSLGLMGLWICSNEESLAGIFPSGI